jgi:tetratricopeptide (TPR) repeat protein
MQESTQPYSPVYHFLDSHLFERFIDGIPRADLIEYARAHESLRNRYFPGFRFSSTVPNSRQILAAYEKEIIERSNPDLASSLCRHWIRRQPSLTHMALTALGISSKDPADADLWIEEVHDKLTRTSTEEVVRCLIDSLVAHFSDDDINIFISIISHGTDQQRLQSIVTQELQNVASDPLVQKRRIESGLEMARAEIKELEQLATALQAQSKGAMALAGEVLNGLLQEDRELTTSLADDEERSKELTEQIEGLKKTLRECQNERDTKIQNKQKLAKAIARQRESLSKINVDFEKRHKEVTGDLDHKSIQVAEKLTALEQVNNRVEERQKSKAPTSEVAVSRQPVSEEVLFNLVTAQSKIAQTEGQQPSVSPLKNNAVCYQGIQRTFRNAVVLFLRARLTRLFPDDHVQRVKKGFGDDWDKAAQNASKSRENLGTSTTVRDEYDLLGTNHFFGLFDRFYDKIFTSEAGQPPDLPRPVKARFLGNLKAIKDCRDPLSHPVEEEISFEEAHHLLYAAQENLKWLGCNAEAAELSSLAAQLGAEERTSLLRRLPSEDSIYLEFVGRNTLLKELTDCFANPHNKRCLLAGDGGKGKSAAAYRFVQSISSSAAGVQLVVWLSAKQRRFRDGSPTMIESPDFTNANEAIDRLLIEYGATAQDLEKAIPDKKRLLFDYLNEFPAFIVADDIDTVLENDEVVSLFTHEIPHTQSSVLLTSRRAIPGIRSFVVQGFDQLEIEEFVKSRLRLYGLNTLSFTPTVIKEIARVTDGSPLYMEDLMRLAKVVDIHKAIKIWTEKGGDEARKYALQREIEKLSNAARKVLIAAAVTDDSISFAELENVLELSEERLLSALTELQTLFLFPKAPAVEGEQRYQINLNTKKLVRLVEGPNEFYARIDNRSKALAGKLPVVKHSIIGSLIRQALLRVNASQFAEAETILVGALEKYANAPDLHGVLGYVYKRMGRVADARTQFESAFRLKANNREMYLHWQKMEIAEREWSKALAVAERALKLLPDAYEIIEGKVYTLRQAGFDFHRGLHREKAVRMWTEAVEEVKRKIKLPETLPAGERALNASMYYSMVVCLDMLHELRERNYWLERWEKEHPDDPQVSAQKEFLRQKRGSLQFS